MMIQTKGKVCLCKECGNLDYALGKCSKCGSKNIECVEDTMTIGTKAHQNWMTYIFCQNYNFDGN